MRSTEKEGEGKQKWRDLDSDIVICSSTAMPTDTGYEKGGVKHLIGKQFAEE
jgi:hypothetical protein